jgi:predicted phage terminase large subunit-like protein
VESTQSWSDFDLYEAYLDAKAKDDFLTYRLRMNPRARVGWFFYEVTAKLQQFYNDLEQGLKPKLIIQAPPQHGKSEAITDFIAWTAGKNPDLRTIYASFSERLGVRANLKMQRAIASPRYKNIFETCLNERNITTLSGQALRNKEILEYVGHKGYFRNTTVQGSITGEGLDLGVIDDPIKGREQANSPTIRNKSWDWFTDDFFTRFSEDAGLLMILTRWHLDDPAGRMIEKFGTAVDVVTYKAIATEDEEHRSEGEALFPELKSLEFLLERKATMPVSNWEALYQQSPVVIGGHIFRDDWWRYYTHPPVVTHRIIYADTAQKTKEHNDYSVFQCWGLTKDGQAILLDQSRGKWEAPELLVQARAFYAKHKALDVGVLRAMKIEDKVSGTGLIQTLKREGIPVLPIQRNTDKVTRAMDVAPMIQSGNVLLPQNAPWLSDFLAEASVFPNGAHDDQLDPMFDAISDLLLTTAKQDLIMEFL